MIAASIFKDLDPTKHAASFAYAAQSLIIATRLALENDASGTSPVVRCAAAANALEVIEAMMGVVIDGTDGLDRSETAPPTAA